MDVGAPSLARQGVTERLNQGCFCITLDRNLLAEALDLEVGVAGFAEQLTTSHPTLFSNVPVFVPSATFGGMTRIVSAIEAAARLPQYQEAALSLAPPIAHRAFGPIGAFMGYDFHITPEGPRLIEVNTNAGGGFLNAFLARAQRGCCGQALSPLEIEPAAAVGARIVQMFVDEWRLQRGNGKPKLIAIVDDAPEQQHLYPEFRLAKAMLEDNGIKTVIADASELEYDGHALTIPGRPIDLVYNRLVDFALDEPRHTALREAYIGEAAVVTPNPHVHALFADKRNLALLSDLQNLKHWGLEEKHASILESGVPKTVVVLAGNADELWHDRNQLFFKPARGYASKAAYRGEKITHKVWGQITSGDYVAQTYAAPSSRGVAEAGKHTTLKVDIRLYTYAGLPLLAAARLYQGQTTNMRTPGGGFAPVLIVRADGKV